MTDGNRVYLAAVEHCFDANIDYAVLIKHYGGEGNNTRPEHATAPEAFYPLARHAYAAIPIRTTFPLATPNALTSQ
jgi:hypothetical protein